MVIHHFQLLHSAVLQGTVNTLNSLLAAEKNISTYLIRDS